MQRKIALRIQLLLAIYLFKFSMFIMPMYLCMTLVPIIFKLKDKIHNKKKI